MSKLLRHMEDGRITFYCPACKNYHWINDTWTLTGTEENPTINPSIRVSGMVAGNPNGICHFFVRNGYIEYLSDCTHDFAGNKIMMEPEDGYEYSLI